MPILTNSNLFAKKSMGFFRDFFSRQTLSKAKIYFIFFVLSQAFYQIGLTNFTTLAFDEGHYVPSAQKMLKTLEHSLPEHPPLAVELIATSIFLFGDTPFGWRALSAFFGSLLILGLLALCFACGMRTARVVYVGVLALCSFFIYIHARIAIQEIFLGTFVIWAIVFLVHALFTYKISTKILLLSFSAFLWGLAAAVKWNALVGYLTCLVYLLVLKTVKEINFSGQKINNVYCWHDARFLQSLNFFLIFTLYIGYFIVAYALPHVAIGKFDIIGNIKEAWTLQHSVPSNHPYHSPYWQWFLMIRPIWYEFRHIGNDLTRPIFCLGNPAIMILGLFSLFFSIRSWFKYNSMLSFICVTFYCAFYFFWMFVKRDVFFHYYYFLPLLFLLLSTGNAFGAFLGMRKRWLAITVLSLAILFFIWYFPVISGFPLKHAARNLHLWSWFRSWI